jgi:hypothetical protein
VAEEPGQSESEKPPEQPAAKQPGIPLEVQEQRLSPRPSSWPIALAFALVVACIGVIVHPILLIFGIVLTIAVLIGWILERH